MKGALDTALTYLSRRALSRYELIQRLVKKGFSEDEIKKALERLKEWGYINDLEYSRTYCLSKNRSYSKKRICYELKGRGVGEDIIEKVLNETYLPEQEIALCLQQAEKFWSEELRRWETTYQYKKSYAKIPQDVFLKQKIGKKLLQKGYPQEMVFQVLHRNLDKNYLSEQEE